MRRHKLRQYVSPFYIGEKWYWQVFYYAMRMSHIILQSQPTTLSRLSKSTPTFTRILGGGLGLPCIALFYVSPCTFTVGFPIQTGYCQYHTSGALMVHKIFDAAAGVHLESRLKVVRLVHKFI